MNSVLYVYFHCCEYFMTEALSIFLCYTESNQIYSLTVSKKNRLKQNGRRKEEEEEEEEEEQQQQQQQKQ